MNFRLLPIFLLMTVFAHAQQKSPKNNFYAEAGGNGLFGSLNYERQLSRKPGFAVHAGFGFYTEDHLYLTIPAGVDILFPLKKQDRYIDWGMDMTWASNNGNFFGQNRLGSTVPHFVSFIPSLGYRAHMKNDLFWRFGFSPVINRYGFVPWAGFAFGKRF